MKQIASRDFHLFNKLTLDLLGSRFFKLSLSDLNCFYLLVGGELFVYNVYRFLYSVLYGIVINVSRELGIRSLYDLLYYFPYKYIDRSRVFKVSELGGQLQHVQLLGEIRSFEEMGEGASRRLVAHFTDGTAFVDLVWFRGIKFVRNRLQLNRKYVVIRSFKWQRSMILLA